MKLQNRTRKEDNAVSPVIGVMLMLVVTIIIAGLVSAFAGGLFTTVDTPSQVTFKVESVLSGFPDTDKTNAQPDGDSKINNGIQFRHAGGNTLYLNALTIQLKTDSELMSFSFTTEQNASTRASYPTLQSMGKQTYFYMGGTDYTELNAGDAFMLLADNCYDSTKATDETITKGRFITFHPKDSAGELVLQKGKEITYSIIETATGTTLQRGTLIL